MFHTRERSTIFMSLFDRLSSSRRIIAVALLLPMTLGGLASSARAASGSTSANTLSIGWATETQTLDPAGHVQNPDIWVNVNIYDQLVRVGADGTSLNPDLATSWSLSRIASPIPSISGPMWCFRMAQSSPPRIFASPSRAPCSQVSPGAGR